MALALKHYRVPKMRPCIFVSEPARTAKYLRATYSASWKKNREADNGFKWMLGVFCNSFFTILPVNNIILIKITSKVHISKVTMLQQSFLSVINCVCG